MCTQYDTRVAAMAAEQHACYINGLVVNYGISNTYVLEIP